MYGDETETQLLDRSASKRNLL